MPSADLLLHVAGEVEVEDRWAVAGSHYARTCEAWIERMDAERGRIVQLFADAYGSGAADARSPRWRTFNLACAELFASGGGEEWIATHLRLRKR